MITHAPTSSFLANYQLRLPVFAGPLDVLLRLIERHRLPITDVSLVTISDQFLEFTRELDQTEPTFVAEFAAIAARLTVLKSRSILPRTVPDDDDPEPSDLTVRLREYQRMKQLAAHLGEIHGQGSPAFSPSGGAVVIPRAITSRRLARYDIQVLVRSLRRRLSVIPQPVTVIRQRRVISIREAIDRISDLLETRSDLRFRQIIAPLRHRTDVATAFLAILVMVRRGVVTIEQDELFGDFGITNVPGAHHNLDAEIGEFID